MYAKAFEPVNKNSKKLRKKKKEREIWLLSEKWQIFIVKNKIMKKKN